MNLFNGLFKKDIQASKVYINTTIMIDERSPLDKSGKSFIVFNKSELDGINRIDTLYFADVEKNALQLSRIFKVKYNYEER